MTRFGLYLVFAACGGGGGFPDAGPGDGAGPTGTFSVSWTVNDQNNLPLSCDRIAAQAMTVLTHNFAFEGGATQVFTCATGMGMSQGLEPGRYEMDFELSGTFGSLARAAKQAPVDIKPSANVELMPVAFQVEALGGLALKLATGKAGGNCGAANQGGAGIDEVSITLSHNSDGSCEPITLVISDGATQTGGSYTINCTTPVVRGCIEADQTLTATGVESDSYTIRIRGLITGKQCWLNMDTIQVPPLNKVLIRTLNLAQQTQTPGC
ncbi:MAG TPA: hypothetical protein VIV11_31420 [Kofleriaceae bacterium]